MSAPESDPSVVTASAMPKPRLTPLPPHLRRELAQVTREAITLPLIFLTVAALGGLRVASGSQQLRFLPPSLMALVLALFLVGALVRCGALTPERLVDPARQGLANASGIIVLASLFFASAQAFNLATPDSGLLQFLFNLFFVLLLWNTLAARPDRRRLLSSLMVLFGGAFIARYVLLAALYDPQGGLTKRVLTAMLEGVTLGGIAYAAPAPVTGYVAFFALLLFLIGLSLLPAGPPAREPFSAEVTDVIVIDPAGAPLEPRDRDDR